MKEILNNNISLKKKILYISIGCIFFVAIWWLLAYFVNELNIFPTPDIVIANSFNVLKQKITYIALLTTLGLALLSILISSLIAIFLGLLSAYFQFFKHFFKPFVSFFKIIPTACIVILLLIFFDNIFSYLIIVFLIVFPIVYDATIKGIDNISDEIKLSLCLEGISKFNSIRRVILPEASNYIILGIINGVGVGIKVEIMAEILSFSNNNIKGIGYLIEEARTVTFDYVSIYSYILLVAFIFLFFNLILFGIKKTLKFID